MAPTLRHEIHVSVNAEELALDAAGLFAAISKEAIAARGKFQAALAGGTTPLKLYSLLATEPYRSGVDWKHIEFFFGDERCVPPDHRNSNFRAINEALLSHVPTIAHRIAGELPPREAAVNYERDIRRAFKVQKGLPVFDLMLLGLGSDGHTASLFPNSDALLPKERLAVETYVKHLESWRVTLTLPVINSARKVAFLVSGSDKATIVREVLEEGQRCPASLVVPEGGEILWLLDAASASLL